MLWILLISTCFVGASLAQAEPEGVLSTPIAIPPELQAKLNDSQVESVKNKYMNEFKQKCEKNGHPEIFENSQSAMNVFMTCFNSLVDMNALQDEIEAAKPTGQVDEVFKKYCAKTPDFKKCFRNATETVKPCFSADEQKNFKTLYNVTDQLAEFICFKDGDRIALFIAEGGKECFEQQQEAVQNCFNQTIDSETIGAAQNITFESLMELEFKEKQCTQLSQLQTCIVKTLENCVKPTSANIVESLFNFVRKATPCKAYMVTQTKKKNSASSLAITSATLVTALAASILV